MEALLEKYGFYERLLSLRRIPMRVVILTALSSYVLQIGAIVQGQPLYIIVGVTMLPWIPTIFFESWWRIKHYQWIAIFMIVTVLQIGHVGEHVTQVGQLKVFNGTLACPPPVDNPIHVERAIEAGLRSPDSEPTFISTQRVVKPNAEGLPTVDAAGNDVTGPAACGIFGQLDLEVVHLVWEVLGLIATSLLVIRFPKNVWLWIAMGFLTLHTVEHFFISWIFFADNEMVFNGVKQLWATTVEGNIVTAHPIGKESVLVNFYGAGGKNGILAKGGMVDVLLFGGNAGFLPERAVIHMIYNFGITIPTGIGFLVQANHLYDEYLAQALPELTEQQLHSATEKLEQLKFAEGEDIITEGDPPTRFYIVSSGEVDIVKDEDGEEVHLAKLGPGQYFGEISLIQGTDAIATVRAATDVEVMALDPETFGGLMFDSDNAKVAVERIAQERRSKTEHLHDED